jgi:hypothetical protein
MIFRRWRGLSRSSAPDTTWYSATDFKVASRRERNIGFVAMLFWAFAKVIAIQRGLLLHDALFERLRQAMPLERGLILGVILLLLGLTILVV